MTEDILRKPDPQQETNNNRSVPNGDKMTRKGTEGVTEFKRRNSPLSSPLEYLPKLQAMLSIFFAIQFLIFLDTFIYDYIALGRINLGTATMSKGFGDYRLAFRLWYFEFGLALTFYACLRLYDYGAKNIKSESLYGVWKFFGIVGVIMMQCLLIGVPSYQIITKNLALGSTIAVACEMFRFAMKIHAVAVSCGPRCRAGTAPLPSFLHYLYFLFAPTLVYRDEYPMHLIVRWDLVIYNFATVAGLAFSIGFLGERFMLPMWSDYGKESTVEAAVIVRNIFVGIVPGMISYISVFYLFLHCWLNAFAEFMFFGDRLFYKEWWTASDMSVFISSWNRVVHSWLREYVYTPLFPRFGRGLSVIAVFVVSAIAHEVIAALALGAFFPVMWVIYFGIGLIMFPLTITLGKQNPGLGNFIVWLGLFLGNGLLWSLYPMEYFARQNCPPSENDSFFIPKILSCPKIVFNNTVSYLH